MTVVQCTPLLTLTMSPPIWPLSLLITSMGSLLKCTVMLWFASTLQDTHEDREGRQEPRTNPQFRRTLSLAQ